MSTATYQREWRARHGARTGILGRPRTHDCGTAAAYSRHKRNGEPVDEACRLAWNAYQKERRDLRIAAQKAEAAEVEREAKRAKDRARRAAKKAEAARPKTAPKVKARAKAAPGSVTSQAKAKGKPKPKAG